jgi:hypothetical protein
LKLAPAVVFALLAFASAAAAQTLKARVEGEQLHVAAARIHLLTGEALERLHDGATVNYEFQLTARTDRAGSLLARAVARFAVSYDLWEEKFAVMKLSGAPKSASNLSAAAAEAWCIENVSMPVGVLPVDQAFWLRLEYRAEESTPNGEQSENSTFRLSTLVDIFSRRTRGEQVHGSEEGGPLRLPELKKKD